MSQRLDKYSKKIMRLNIQLHRQKFLNYLENTGNEDHTVLKTKVKLHLEKSNLNYNAEIKAEQVQYNSSSDDSVRNNEDCNESFLADQCNENYLYSSSDINIPVSVTDHLNTSEQTNNLLKYHRKLEYNRNMALEYRVKLAKRFDTLRELLCKRCVKSEKSILLAAIKECKFLKCFEKQMLMEKKKCVMRQIKI